MTTKPARVSDVQTYWQKPPPEKSARLAYWEQRIIEGWRPNGRVRSMGYHEAAEFYGVYIWEYLNVISPMLDGARNITWSVGGLGWLDEERGQ